MNFLASPQLAQKNITYYKGVIIVSSSYGVKYKDVKNTTNYVNQKIPKILRRRCKCRR
jgi:hypothetical protein